MGKATTFTLPFIKKEKVAKDTYSFFFDRKGVDFDFEPGQYLRMHLPHTNPDTRGTTRYFTIASSPHIKDVVMFTVRIFDSSFKRTLHDLQAGEMVQFFGPMGWFLLPKDEEMEKVFVAGGIGVTPFHSLLHYLSDKQLTQQITLFVSFKTKEEIVFYDELQMIAKQNKKIRIIYTLTQEQAGDVYWSGEIGRVSEEMFKKHLIDIQKPVYYVVGSPKMVEETKAFLVGLGIDEEKIQLEDFTGY
jgi:glycine betaine catabolism B